MIVDPTKDVDATRFRTFAELEEAVRFLPAAPSVAARLDLVVSRSEEGHRVLGGPTALSLGAGIPGDAWHRKEGATIESVITVMQTPIAELIANGQPLALFGDNLFVDLDLSIENLPTGSRVAIGGASFEVSTKTHKGCKKFAARFGVDALRFVATPHGRERRFRGLYLIVTEPGEIAPGDRIEIIERASAEETAV